MRDGRTRKLATKTPDRSFAGYLTRWRPSLVVVGGAAAGTELAIESETTTLGRGPGVALAFGDPAMSREHAALEFTGEGFRIRDLGSMNGIALNGRDVKVGDLKHGDRIGIGEHELRFLLEERAREPRTYVVSDT